MGTKGSERGGKNEGRDGLEQPLHSDTSHSCSHLAAIHTLPITDYPSLPFTDT